MTDSLAKKSAVNGLVQCNVKLNGKTVIITGANSGIGYETALDLAKRGAKIIMACRNSQKAEEAKTKLLKEVNDAKIIVKKLDLGSLKSVRECANDINETESRLDILINNAGIMLCPPSKTEDGFEMQFGVNHIGHFVFTNELLDLLKKSAPSRIVIVSSLAHSMSNILWDNIMQETNYNSLHAYGQSKTANILHCLELSKRLEGTGVTSYCLHPGAIKTNLQQHLGDLSHLPFFTRMFVKTWNPALRLFGISPFKGAQTSIYCAIAPELENISGKYYSNCLQTNPSSYARRPENAERLWKVTEEFVAKADKQKIGTEEQGDAKAKDGYAQDLNKVDSAQEPLSQSKDDSVITKEEFPIEKGEGDAAANTTKKEPHTQQGEGDATASNPIKVEPYIQHGNSEVTVVSAEEEINASKQTAAENNKPDVKESTLTEQQDLIVNHEVIKQEEISIEQQKEDIAEKISSLEN